MNNSKTLVASKDIIKDIKTILNVMAIVLLNTILFLRPLFNYYTIILFGISALLLVSFIIEIDKRKIPKYTIPLLVYTLIVILNSFWGGDSNYVTTFTLCILIFVCLISLKDFALIQYKCFFGFSLFHLLFNIAVILLPQTIINTVLSRILGVGYHSNYDWRIVQGVNPGLTLQPGDNAMYLMVFFAICFANLFFGKKKNKKFYILGLLLCYFCIISTGKRFACLFSVFTAVLILLILAKNKKRILRLIILGLILIALLVLVTPVFDSILHKSNNDISNGRFELWSYAMDKFLSKPVFGVGLKNIYKEIGLDVHNTYIQILAETGIVGISVFIVAIFNLVRHSYFNLRGFIKVKKQKLKCRNVLVGFYLIVFLLIYGLTGNTFIDYLPLMLIILSMCMANSAYAR